MTKSFGRWDFSLAADRRRPTSALFPLSGCSHALSIQHRRRLGARLMSSVAVYRGTTMMAKVNGTVMLFRDPSGSLTRGDEFKIAR